MPKGWPQFGGFKPLGKDEIRLLDFGNLGIIQCDTDALELTIEHVGLRNCPPYHALSYNWGPELHSHTVFVDGCEVEVRESPWLFLRSLRRHVQHKNLPTKFWLDCLYINQRNTTERSEQVQMMGEIFASADGVFAWIGDGNGNTDTFFEAVGNHRAQVQQERALERSHDPKNYKNLIWRNLLMSEPIASGLRDVMRRPYWTRLWIIQEVALSKNATLVCGQHFIPWQDFEEPIDKYMHHWYYEQNNYPPGWRDNTMSAGTAMGENASLWSQLQHDKIMRLRSFKLSDIVDSFWKSRCVDPRDKIYGVLALAVDRKRFAFPINYQKDAFEVMVDFWVYFIENDQDTKLSRQEEIPRWVCVLWMHMNLQCHARFFAARPTHINTIEQAFGSQHFEVSTSMLGILSDFTQEELSNSIDCSTKQLVSVRNESKCEDDSILRRNWLMYTDTQVLKGDILLIVMLRWSGDETISLESHQLVVVVRLDTDVLQYVGRGLEIPRGQRARVSEQMIKNFEQRIRPSACYTIHSTNELGWLSCWWIRPGWHPPKLEEMSLFPTMKNALYGRLNTCSGPSLLLNAAAVCEVMQIPWCLSHEGGLDGD